MAATHLVTWVGATRIAIVDLEAGRRHADSSTPTRAMGAHGLARVTLRDVPAEIVETERSVAELLSVSRLLHAARAWGAADRAFELVVDYARERRQFGQPIGRFQAIQHKLASNLIALRATAASLDNAAAQHDRGAPDWRLLEAAASAFANESLRQVSSETHHAFGAIGYAEDHEAPRHFKRIHLDVMRHGGGAFTRSELADRYLGESRTEFPTPDLGRAANALRGEVRSWLARHWPVERRDAYLASEHAHRDYDPDFAREFGRTG